MKCAHCSGAKALPDNDLCLRCERLANSGLKEFEGCYEAISEFYGNRCARRSGVPLINHIDEGYTILKALGADEYTKQAFYIHPLLQDDKELVKNYCRLFPVRPMVLAMEYRSVANEALAHHQKKASQIRLSPLNEVNQMLIADKVQNRKDFLIHHSKTHENRTFLDWYFKQWLIALGIDDDRYAELEAMIY